MKKVLRFILILLVVIIGGYLVLCLVAPKETSVEKSTVINAPVSTVWPQMVNYKHWDNWNPWKEADPTVTSTITGPEGAAGQKSLWVSDESGSGEMTIASVDGNTMNYDMHFIEPFESDSKGWVKAEAIEGNKTKATWAFTTEPTFFMKGAFLLFGKSQLEKSFARGMELLKKHVESGNAKPVFNIDEITFPTTSYVTVRETVSMDSLIKAFTRNKEKLDEIVKDNADGNFSAIFYDWNPETNMTDFAVAYPVKPTVNGPNMVTVPESECYKIRYTGDYDISEQVHGQLEEYAKSKGKEILYKIEEYEQGPFNQADPKQYITDIYYLVK